MLEELDGSRLASILSDNRLKKFHLRERLQLDHTTNLDHEEIPTLDDFLANDIDSDLSDTSNNLFDLCQFPPRSAPDASEQLVKMR